MANPFDDVTIEPEVQQDTQTNGMTWATPIQPVQQVKTQYTTAIAVQKPRDLMQVRKTSLFEAERLGEDAYYGWGVGDNRVEGPSVKLTNMLVRNYGNCAVECKDVTETPTAFLYMGSAIDFETGYNMTRPFRQSRAWKVYGKMDEERKEDVRFEIGASKCTRNVSLNFLPAWLVDECMVRAKEGSRKKIEQYIAKSSLPAAQDAMLKELAKVGVKEEQVLQACDIAAKTALTVELLVSLNGSLHAIQRGEARVSELFPAVQAPTPEQRPQDGTKPGSVDALKDTLKAKSTTKQESPQEKTAEGQGQKPEPQMTPSTGTQATLDLPLDSKE